MECDVNARRTQVHFCRLALFQARGAAAHLVIGCGEERVVRRGMIIDAFIAFARVCMDNHLDHGGEFVEERMAHRFCDEVPL
jgi:hypothetical protein